MSQCRPPKIQVHNNQLSSANILFEIYVFIKYFSISCLHLCNDIIPSVDFSELLHNFLLFLSGKIIDSATQFNMMRNQDTFGGFGSFPGGSFAEFSQTSQKPLPAGQCEGPTGSSIQAQESLYFESSNITLHHSNMPASFVHLPPNTSPSPLEVSHNSSQLLQAHDSGHFYSDTGSSFRQQETTVQIHDQPQSSVGNIFMPIVELSSDQR